MPPRPPFFVGRTIVAADAPTRDASPLLEIRPRPGHGFTAPIGTHTLYLPPESLATASPVGAAIEFTGDLKRCGYPPALTLAPVDEDDAVRLCEVLARRHGLPRAPIDLPPDRLSRALAGEYVSVVDVHRPGHCEAADFGAMVVDTPDRARTLEPGHTYRATGFYRPGRSPDAPGPPAVGYNGPVLAAVTIERPPFASAALDPRGGRLDARLGHAHGRWLSASTGGRRLVGLVRGLAGQGFAPTAAEALLVALRHLFAVDLARATRPPPGVWLRMDELVAAAVDGGPLPDEAIALLEAVDHRVGAAFAALRAAHFDFIADGVLACVDGRRIAALRRGRARIYRTCPNGQVVLEVVEDTLARIADAADVAVEAWQRDLLISCFGQRADDDKGPRIFELAADERLVVVSGAILQARAPQALAGALAAADLVDLVRRLEEAGPPLDSDEWGVLVIAPGR